VVPTFPPQFPTHPRMPLHRFTLLGYVTGLLFFPQDLPRFALNRFAIWSISEQLISTHYTPTLVGLRWSDTHSGYWTATPRFLFNVELRFPCRSSWWCSPSFLHTHTVGWCDTPTTGDPDYSFYDGSLVTHTHTGCWTTIHGSTFHTDLPWMWHSHHTFTHTQFGSVPSHTRLFVVYIMIEPHTVVVDSSTVLFMVPHDDAGGWIYHTFWLLHIYFFFYHNFCTHKWMVTFFLITHVYFVDRSFPIVNPILLLFPTLCLSLPTPHDHI